MFPEPSWNPNSPIQSGEILNLFAPETFGLLSGAACLSGNCTTWFANSNSIPLNPLLYSNPIAVFIDEANKCVSNYTLTGHILRPGRVSRCIVEECGEIKVKTYGNGLHFFGNNFFGATMGKLNELIASEILFANVDDRFYSLVNQTFPLTNPNNANKTSNSQPITTTLGIENKIWTVKQFKVKHPNLNEMVLFDKNVVADSFWNMAALRFFFKADGTYEMIDVQNHFASGIWDTNNTDSITTDGVTAEVFSVTSNEFVVKGVFKSFVDTTLVNSEYTYVFDLASPCTNELTLSQDPIPTGIYAAGNVINLSGRIASGSDAVLNAPNIVLQPGFTLEQDGTLTVNTQGCQ